MLDPLTQARLDRIQESVSLRNLVEDHYKISGKHARDGIQISCPFHSKGGRKDATPSAHVYESSNRFFCFACKDLFTVGQFVAKKEQTSLVRALGLLERWFNLPPLNEVQELLKIPVFPKVVGELGDRALLKAIYGLLEELSPYLSFAQYERAFVAWWTLVAEKAPDKQQCRALLEKLQTIRDEQLILK